MRLDNEPINPSGGNPASPNGTITQGNAPASARSFSPLIRKALIVAGYLIAFTILDLITKQFQELPGVVAWYPPVGLTYALLIVFGFKFAPAVTIVLLIDSVFVYRMPQPPTLLVLWAVILTVVYSAATEFLRKVVHIDWRLGRFRDVTWLVFTTIIVSGFLAAISVTSSAASSGMSQSDILTSIFHWWIGETVGVLTVAPFLLIHVMPSLKRFAEGKQSRRPEARATWRPSLSAVGQVLGITLTLYLVFGTHALDEFHPFYLMAIPLLWITVQRGVKGVSAALLVLNSGVVLAMWLTRFDITRLSELELLMIVNCIADLIMGALVTERKEAVEAVKEGEERFRSLFENASVGMYRTTPEGTILMANPALVKMLGYKSFEELSHNDLEAGGYEPTYPRLEFQNRLHQEGEIHGLESTWKRKNGTNMFVRESAHLARSGNGQPLYYEGTVEDITDKKLKEQELHLLLDTQRQIIEQETIESTFQLAGKKVQELLGDGFVGVTILDENEQVMRITGLYGVGSTYYKLLKRFKVDPTKIAYPLKDMTEDELRLFRSGSLEKFEKGLYSLLVRKVPEKVCSAAEKALRVKGVYTMGFVSHGIHYGGLTILARREISQQKSIIETIVNQATLTLHRIKAETSLRESEEQLRLVTDNMQDLLVQTGLEGLIQYASPSHKTVLGYELGTLPGKSIYDLMHPEDIERVKEFISKPDIAEMTRKLEIRYRHADGNYLWLESAVSTIFDGSGSPAGAVFSNRDITERKRTEAERQALQDIMQGVATTDNLNGLLELIRQSLAKVIYAENYFVVFHNNNTGMYEEVFAVDKYDAPMPPSKLEKSIISYIFRTGEPLLLTQEKFEELVRQGEVELVGTKPAIWMGVPLKTPTGTIGVMAVQNYEDPNCYSERDKDFLSSASAQVAVVIERKQAADKLEEERTLLRTLIDNLPDHIFVMDAQGRKTLSNLADWKASGGKKEEDVIGKTDLDTYPHELAADYWALDKSVMDTGNAIFNREEPGLDPEGNPAWLLSSKVPLRDGQGKVTGLVGIGRDITERKRAEETLQKSEKRFKALVENSLEEISLIAADGTLTWESPSQRRPLGYPPDSFVGHNLLDIFHPDDREAVTRLLSEIVQTPGSIQEAAFRLRHQDGSWRWMEAVVKNLLNEPAVHSIVINYRDITERKQKEFEIQSRNQELTALYQLSRALADAEDLQNVIQLVNRCAVESLNITFACTALVEDGKLQPREVFSVRDLTHDFTTVERQPIEALPICQRVLDQNEPVLLKASDPKLSKVEKSILMLDFIQQVYLVPLRVGDPSQQIKQAMGLMILGEEREEKRESFTPEKIRLARSIGDQAATAIRRLLLSDQAGRRLQHLASLSEIDRTIASNFDLRISMQILLKHVIEQLEVDAADVLVFNKYTRTLEYAAGSGFLSTMLEGTRQPMGEGQAGRAVLERQIIQIPNVAASRTEFAHPDLMKVENIAAYFAVPLITKGQVMGVLEICHRTPLEPNEEWIEFLRTLGGQAAIAIDNVNMFESLQKSTDELELAYDATIEGWSRALDLRDKETEGHTQRVTGMTVELARTFGLSEPDLVNVRWGALLHDIGKMGVPDNILLKPGALTDEEWVVMKKHPALAYEMLSPIRYLQGALDIPYCHHEWWNGSGYPRGLKGEEIPLAARIFAVIDVWDALISDRPYRLAWSKEKALEHIQSGAGTHFDPQVVIKFNAGHA